MTIERANEIVAELRKVPANFDPMDSDMSAAMQAAYSFTPEECDEAHVILFGAKQ